MGAEAFSAEHDLADIIYGPVHLCLFLTHAVVDGASVDTNNDPTTVLRPGLIMAQVTTTQKWKPFASGASDGTQVARGVLTLLGLNTQFDGANTDRYLATIMVGGNLNPEGLCIAETAGYGLARTGAGLAVRKALMYTFRFSDDFISDLTLPVSGR
jgi:hypothetical protein